MDKNNPLKIGSRVTPGHNAAVHRSFLKVCRLIYINAVWLNVEVPCES